MAASEVLWIRFVLHELALTPSSVPTLWCDNQSVAALACNPKFQSRAKHIELDVHFIREKVAANSLQVQYISSFEQPADLLMKALSHRSFYYLSNKLNLVLPG